MIIRGARPSELEGILRLRASAAEWIRTEIDSDQWAKPWPTMEGMRSTIRASIERGETWMVEDDDGYVIGTIAIDQHTAPGLWTAEEMAKPSLYFHRLIIDRSRAGQGAGARIIEWAERRARDLGAWWLRADVWTDNLGLHEYYLKQGFTHVRTVRRDDYPSGALFQKSVRLGGDASRVLAGATSSSSPDSI